MFHHMSETGKPSPPTLPAWLVQINPGFKKVFKNSFFKIFSEDFMVHKILTYAITQMNLKDRLI